MLWVLITLQWYFCPWENHEDICAKECSLMLIIREFILMVFLGGLKNCTKTEILDQRRERNQLRKDIVAKLSLVSMIFKAKQIIYIPSVCWSCIHKHMIWTVHWEWNAVSNYLLSYYCLFHPFLTSKNIG